MAESNVTYIRAKDAGYSCEYRSDIEFEAIQRVLNAEGVVLKRSKKSLTRRVDNWVVKESAQRGILAALRHTFLWGRSRRGWQAAVFLQGHGVAVPAPLAYVEKRRFGFVTGNAMISEFLDGFRNVEEHAKELARVSSDGSSMQGFLLRLADALNRLEASGAYHADLSGKNIFTKDGNEFYFIDLDAVVLERPCDGAMRMKSHIQLYDSFCDFVGAERLVEFLMRILPEGCCMEDWAARVQDGQRRRRKEHEGKNG